MIKKTIFIIIIISLILLSFCGKHNKHNPQVRENNKGVQAHQREQTVIKLSAEEKSQTQYGTFPKHYNIAPFSIA